MTFVSVTSKESATICRITNNYKLKEFTIISLKWIKGHWKFLSTIVTNIPNNLKLIFFRFDLGIINYPETV